MAQRAQRRGASGRPASNMRAQSAQTCRAARRWHTAQWSGNAARSRAPASRASVGNGLRGMDKAVFGSEVTANAARMPRGGRAMAVPDAFGQLRVYCRLAFSPVP